MNTNDHTIIPVQSGSNGMSDTQQVPAIEAPRTVTISEEEYLSLLTDKERVITHKHIQRVAYFLHKIGKKIIDRTESHDQSKLDSPEAELFAEHGHKLADLDFGSDEYKESLKALEPALNHHYANNRHHPEHFKNGIEDMNIIDIIEMFCDWKASSERQRSGNLRKTLEQAGQRFNMDPILIRILENSIDILE
jgi:hypothetical protein